MFKGKKGVVNHFVYDLLILYIERKIFDANLHSLSYSCHICHKSTCNVKKYIPPCVQGIWSSRMCVSLHRTPFKIKPSITFNTVVPSAFLTRPTATQIGLYRNRGYHRHVAEDSNLLGCVRRVDW
jgi:hypothetical protein